MKDIIHIKSITEVHQFLGLAKPKHPLISVFTLSNELFESASEDFNYVFGLFQISIKGNCPYTISKYGRNTYDFQECSMIFTAPNQLLEFNTKYKPEDDSCWTLVFHPDLIRKSELGKNIDAYSFFSYSSTEALHLSDEERQIVSEIASKIAREYNNNIDAHSQTLIISNLELLLNYCVRFYDRQFHTRTNLNQDLAFDFEQLLKQYYEDQLQTSLGIPTVKYCAEQLNMSSRYLSDMLRKETGKSAQDHIHHFLIEKAKLKLLNSKDSASSIAYQLGFEYSQYFSKFFKKKTTMSPNAYRQNLNE